MAVRSGLLIRTNSQNNHSILRQVSVDLPTSMLDVDYMCTSTVCANMLPRRLARPNVTRESTHLHRAGIARFAVCVWGQCSSLWGETWDIRLQSGFVHEMGRVLFKFPRANQDVTPFRVIGKLRPRCELPFTSWRRILTYIHTPRKSSPGPDCRSQEQCL